MGIIKGILKVGASAVLTVTGTASTILKGMSDTVGLEIGSELFGAAKDASFNGIRTMWDMEAPQEEEFATEEEARRDANAREKTRLKAQALRCKEMAQKASDSDTRDNFMARYEELMEQAESLDD